ncbi:WD40 repeat-like protein [Mycena latifolia]|nr:WD40 repeat-like protein [Mycena latifolia]
MIQTGLIPSAHNDLVTDASYDFYGLRLATCGLDQRIKIWQMDETNGSWAVEDDWKAHDAAVSKISWAHPEFGTIIASASFDRTVKVWEQAAMPVSQPAAVNGSANANATTSRWIERAVLPEARGTVPRRRVCPEPLWPQTRILSRPTTTCASTSASSSPALTTWQLAEEVDVQALSPSPVAPQIRHAYADERRRLPPADAPLLAQALAQSVSASAPPRPGIGTREADGGWCLAWCRDRYWGELLAAAAGTTGRVKIIQLAPARRPATLLTLDPCAGGVRGGWRRGGDERRVGAVVRPLDEEDGEWAASIVADFDQHRSAVGRVEWNITGTVLASAGNDGRVRLWKATAGNVWRPAGSVGVEQAGEGGGDGDVEM